MRQVPKLIPLYGTVFLNETSKTMLTPLLAILFFNSHSPLFNTPVSAAEQGLLYGLAIAIMRIGWLVGSPIIAILSDHVGRKYALLLSSFGLILPAILSLIAIALNSLFLFFTGLVLFGLYAARPIGIAMVGDYSITSQKAHNMAWFQCAVSIGACLGPILSGALMSISWHFSNYQITLLAICLFALIAILVVAKFIQNSTPQRSLAKAKTTLKSFKALCKQADIRWLLIMVACAQFSWSAYYEFMPAVIKKVFMFSNFEIGLFMGLIAFWLIIGSGGIIHWLLKRTHKANIVLAAILSIFLGNLSALSAILYSTISGSHLLVWLSAIPTAIGDVILYSLLLTEISNRTSKTHQGKAIALVYLIIPIVWSTMGLIGGYSMRFFTFGPFLIAPIGTLILLIFFNRFSLLFHCPSSKVRGYS